MVQQKLRKRFRGGGGYESHTAGEDGHTHEHVDLGTGSDIGSFLTDDGQAGGGKRRRGSRRRGSRRRGSRRRSGSRRRGNRRSGSRRRASRRRGSRRRR